MRVTGTIRNLGSEYSSSPGSQIASLFEGDTLVDSRDFLNLAPGESFELGFERPWNASSPAEGEFPPRYRLTIIYDPDISADGNALNDDCRSDNNTFERSGAFINGLF